MINYRKTAYLRSAGSTESFLRDTLPQVAMAGRSNVGKSSVINALTSQKNLARVGSAPGKTTQINYFLVDETFYLVDLPGYGYAKVPMAEKERWGKLMEKYFAAEDTIDYGVMIVDARHKPTANDVIMADYFKASGKPFVVVANKMDKLKKSEIEPNLACIRETLTLPETVELIPFSAENGLGREALLRVLLRVAGE